MAGVVSSGTNLVHGSYYCPGLHGAGAVRQDIQRRTFAELLGGSKSFEIPIFQRAYCWPQQLAESWWRDVWSGSRCPIGGQHSTGKILLFPATDNINTMLVIDGQQRLVTSCLCIAALRDRALKVVSSIQNKEDVAYSQLTELISSLNNILFRDMSAAAEWCKSAAGSIEQVETESKNMIWEKMLPEGTCPDFISLIPSFYDRTAFARLLLEGQCSRSMQASATHNPRKPSEVNKAWFDNVVAKLCCNLKGSAVVRVLTQAARGAMELMGVMAITAIDPRPGLAQQVYLWYQENSLMGMGSLLLNPCPGITLTASDLARNLVLAPLISLGTTHMDCIMREHWLPLEKRFESTSHFDMFLSRFVRQTPVAPTSPAVANLLEFVKASPRNSALESIELYLQFVSTYDQILASIPEDWRQDALSTLDSEASTAYRGTVYVIQAMQEFANAEANALTCSSAQVVTRLTQKKRIPPCCVDALVQQVMETSNRSDCGSECA